MSPLEAPALTDAQMIAAIAQLRTRMHDFTGAGAGAGRELPPALSAALEQAHRELFQFQLALQAPAPEPSI